MQKIKLKYVTMTAIGRSGGTYRDLLAQSAREALADDVYDATRIRDVFLSSFAPRELCGIEDARDELSTVLNSLVPGWAPEIHGPFKTGGEALHAAVQHIDAQAEGDVLVIGCEKMTHLDAGTAAGLLAPRVSPRDEQRYGATLPALGALATRAYMRRQRVPYHAFHHVAAKNHYHGSLNPLAHFRKEVSIGTIATSPLVSDPLRRHHCAPMSDGAAACVLSRDGGDVSLTGWGIGLDARLFQDRRDPARFVAASQAARSAFAMSGRAPRDVSVVEIHDAFSPFELMNLEAMGFFAPGEAWRDLERGEFHVGGRLAVNPSGGMKARGHPIGVCGLTSVVEMFTQLTGTAGQRQQKGASVGVVQSAGGVSRDTYAFVMESGA